MNVFAHLQPLYTKNSDLSREKRKFTKYLKVFLVKNSKKGLTNKKNGYIMCAVEGKGVFEIRFSRTLLLF